MSHICVYSGDSLKTRDKIMGNILAYTVNKVYKNKEYNIYYKINQHGYLHVLRPSNVKMNGKIIEYAIHDYLLTKDNMLEDKGIIFQSDTIECIVDKLEDMTK